MNTIRYLKITLAIFLGVMVISPLTPVSAMTATQTMKIKVANMTYAKTIAKAKLDFKIAIKPSYDAVLAIGKPAELVRRAKVKTALASFNSIVFVEKTPSIMAEKAYKVIILKLVANPTNLQLKGEAQAALLALKKATAALKIDTKIKVARLTFEKQRSKAMTAFKATVLSSVKVRLKVQTREVAKFNVTRLKAQLTLKNYS